MGSLLGQVKDLCGIVNIVETALWAPLKIRTALIAILVGIAYYLGAKIGLTLRSPPDYIATFWPSNAIILATFI